MLYAGVVFATVTVKEISKPLSGLPVSACVACETIVDECVVNVPSNSTAL